MGALEFNEVPVVGGGDDVSEPTPDETDITLDPMVWESDELPPWAEHTDCILIRCSRCSCKYDEDGKYTVHFHDVAPGLSDVADAGWGLVDGELLCTSCLDKVRCERFGHTEWFYFAANAHRPQEYWTCIRCSTQVLEEPAGEIIRGWGRG